MSVFDSRIAASPALLTHRILSVDELKQECSTAPFDLTILVDGSGSVLPTDYAGSLDFIQELLSMFTYGSEGTRVTLAQFSTDLMTYAQCFRHNRKNQIRF